ncbi:uncharacterized protein LOC122707820 [Cervus elaphus]|uniref:uncharacterized protein LOC122707820 n=1 Tax=Cervus elaphus TaxID=9860 RepID=UPI001CC2C7A6|nr:uncharacterized protein LOC122707820 [Cervus elaphus]
MAREGWRAIVASARYDLVTKPPPPSNVLQQEWPWSPRAGPYGVQGNLRPKERRKACSGSQKVWLDRVCGAGLPTDCFGVWPGAWLSRAKPGPEFSCLACVQSWGLGEAPAGTGRSESSGASSPFGRGTRGLPFRLPARLGSEAEPVGAMGTGRGGHWCWPASLCPAETRHMDQRRPLLCRLWTLPALPVLGPCKQEPIWGCVPVSLNLLSTHFLCLATEVLTLTPSPGLGGLSSAHGLDQFRFPGRLSALSRGLEFRQNFWKARLPPPLVTWERSLQSCGPALLPGVARNLDPGPQASSPVVQGPASHMTA